MSRTDQSTPVAVITGGAGGIGLATARLLAQKGFRLVLADIHQTGLERAAAELGPGHLTSGADITDEAQVSVLTDWVMSKTGRVDLLVNNAGTVLTTPWADTPLDSLKAELRLNYWAAAMCTHYFARPMIQAGRGSIVSVASLAALLPLPESSGYTASKAALRGLMLSLHLALKPLGVHVGVVCPTAVDTPMLLREAKEGGSVLNFLQKPLKPEAVARAIWRNTSKRRMETCVPRGEGVWSKLGGMCPWLLPRILPRLEGMATRGRDKYLAQKTNK